MSLPPLLELPLAFCAFTSLATYVLSIITGNASQVDRLWTFLPTIYTAYWAGYPLWPHAHEKYPFKSLLAPYVAGNVPRGVGEDFNQRALLMLALQLIWTYRLSYNTWRRGLFRLDDEDYRWAILRQKIPAWFFQVVNITFISIIQNLLLLGLAIPTYFALIEPSPLGFSDGALAFTALALLAFEFTADNQQFAFHAWKASVLSARAPRYSASEHWPGARLAFTEADAKRGFLTRGLWAWSRHPNFFAEQSFWGVINLIPLLASSAPLPSGASFAAALQRTVPLLPALALNVLFLSSTLFTEGISLEKYPVGYRAYRRQVGMFVPWGRVGMRVLGVGREDDADLVWGRGREEAVKGKVE
ncbi:DUF1295-domain-containing protein [Auriscalpium vulgare]|uniref:DUF1295-domain-containing protein n=1 Tax=Auriscalpium vulgare TaxID=40419 RepID=A0ACB8RXU6_9AGAM|nr:DUF1295-domain-containing protein [Auriscalpium vulgare]